MGSKKYRPIRFLRNTTIADSREAAILKLNIAENKVGQPVIIKYFSDPDKTKIDIVFAIGISEGSGLGTYRIIATGGVLVVNDVVTELPDVSQLVHGESYIYVDTVLKENYLVFLEGADRVYVPLEEEQTIVSLATGKSYYASGEIVKEVSDFYTQEQIDILLANLGDDMDTLQKELEEKLDELKSNVDNLRKDLEESIKNLDEELSKEIQELMIEVFPLTIKFDTPTKIYEVGTSNNISFTFSVIRKKLDVTSDCTFTINDVLVTPSSNTFENITDTTTFTLVAQYKDLMSSNASVTVNYVRRSYWATVEDDFIPSAENIKAADSGTLRLKSTLTYVTNLNAQRIFYAYPKSYGKLSHIYDSNGFDYLPDYEISEVSIDGTPYYVYLKGIKATINNFRQQFTY